MSVPVDTSVWSLALRHDAPQDGAEVRELRPLLVEERVVMMRYRWSIAVARSSSRVAKRSRHRRTRSKQAISCKRELGGSSSS